MTTLPPFTGPRRAHHHFFARLSLMSSDSLPVAMITVKVTSCTLKDAHKNKEPVDQRIITTNLLIKEIPRIFFLLRFEK